MQNFDLLTRVLEQVAEQPFVIYNTSHIPHEVPPEYKTGEISYSVSDCSNLTWLDNRYPFFPYIVKNPMFAGPILQRLYFPKNRFPIDHDKGQGKFFLHATPREGWTQLETALKLVINGLTNKMSRELATFSLNYSYFRTPSSYGYRYSYTTREDARQAARRSRNAFVVLMAHASYIISLCPNWKALMQTHFNVSPQWLDDLENSEICSKLVARRGVFVHPNTCEYKKHVKYMIRAKVPLYIWCREKEKSLALVDLPAPTLEELREFRSREERAKQYSTAAADNAPIAPEPENGSGQRRGETYEMFMSRRKERLDWLMLYENESERRVRLTREAAFQALKVPTTSTRVYVWMTDKDSTFELRKFVLPLHAWRILREFDLEHRIYDPISDELDLLETPSDEITEDDLEVATEISVEKPFENSRQWITQTPAAQNPDESNLDVQQQYSKEVSTDSTESFNLPKSFSCLEEVLYKRYGLVWDGEQREFATEHVGETKMDLDTARNLLTDKASPTDSENVSHLVTNFVKWLLQQGSKVPFPYQDFSSENKRPFSQYKNQHFYVVSEMTQTHGQQYFILPHNKQPGEMDWYVVVKEAQTVLQCLRETNWTTRRDLAEGLLRIGAPFSTRIRVGQVAKNRSRTVSCLGKRDEMYLGSVAEYLVYENARNTFVRKREGRAAFLHGGIVWRLAMESVKDSYSATQILAGIWKTVAVAEGKSMVVSDGRIYNDDELSDEEVDLIVGKYQITSKSK